jgi:VWFA-related protein
LPLAWSLSFAQDFSSPHVDTIVAPSAEEPGFALKKRVNEVNLLFIATHRSKPVLGLSREDIRLLDDNKPPAVISDFRTQDGLSLRVGMLIDTSGSVTSQFRFEQKAAGLFLQQVITHKDDLGFVLGFANRANLVQDFANDPELLARGALQLKIGGGTALFDAVHGACHKMKQHEERAPVARVLVVLSDGESNSGDSTLQDALSAAQESEVIIYTISTRFHGDHEQSSSGQRILEDLARHTGGRVLYPEGPRDLAKSFSKISEELRSRYSLSYVPSDFTPDGRFRKIKLEARFAGRKVTVRVRPGYYASIPPPPALGPPPVENRAAAVDP